MIELTEEEATAVAVAVLKDQRLNLDNLSSDQRNSAIAGIALICYHLQILGFKVERPNPGR